PALKAAWHQLAEQSVAGLASTPLDQVSALVVDLAQSLGSTGICVNEAALVTAGDA
ncbi:MAG: hypothetical protein H0V49_00825, partial [Nocardioidaceae bacterium]|nr:hypothetical protein [Nocardioidaceae bacterium]